MKYGRRLLGRLACQRRDDVNVTPLAAEEEGSLSAEKPFRSIDNAAVRALLRIATVDSELQYRRVRWYQQMAMYPVEAASLMATMFGSFSWDKPVLDADGHILPEANPWAMQLGEDIEAVRRSVPGAEVFTSSLTEIWSSGALADLDVSS